MAEPTVGGESTTRTQKRATVFRELPPGAQARSCSELLAELKTPANLSARSLHFSDVDGKDVYNITAPFHLDGKTMIIGRVEPRDTEFSRIVIFEKTKQDHYVPIYSHPDFEGLQDPCITWSDGELILGGVRYPVSLGDGRVGCRMDFYRGRSVEGLRHFMSGPLRMKDIRFKQLPDGRVAIFSRPQGVKGGLGEIGFTLAASWDEITPEMIYEAPLFPGQMRPDEWGGVNEVHLLKNGKLGILGHIACFDSARNRHYYPMAFSLDLASMQPTPIRIIAQRSFFPSGEAKRPDLVDVVFSGGLIRNDNGTAHLFAGTSDTSAAMVELPDPFLEFETA